MAHARTRPDRPREPPAPWVADLLLGVGVTLVLALLIVADVEHTGPDGWAYLWAVGFGALMMVRRSHPTLVVALTVVGFVAYYMAGHSSIGVAAPVAAAVFSAAEAGRLVTAVSGSLAVLVISISYRLGVGQSASFVLGYDLPQNLVLLAASVALGDSLRSRRALQRHAAAIGVLTAQRLRRDAHDRVAAERLAMARDLHDSLGHALSVIHLHAEVAREADAAGTPVRPALDVVGATSADALADLRRTVAGLRRGTPAPGDTFGLVALPDLIAPAEAAGVRVTLDTRVDAPLATDVETAIVRVVQESITNILRHAHAASASVQVHAGAQTVSVRVTDDGRGGARPHADGAGLRGMRERVETLGGTFTAGPTGRGFAVEATLPVGDP